MKIINQSTYSTQQW